MRHQPDWNPNRPQVPVDAKGNWLNYPDYYAKGWELVLDPFHAKMKIVKMVTGRSSKNVILEDEAGKQYPMFVADLIKGIRNGTLEVQSHAGEGYLVADWFPSKRGQNYGIRSI